MNVHLNRILQQEQILAILETLFINYPIRIIRAIARSGKNASSVPWVHLENKITGERRATFISFRDVLDSFWTWLETVNLLFMSLIEVQAIGRAIWHNVEIGQYVYRNDMGWVEIIEKDIIETTNTPRFWVDFAGTLAHIPASSVRLI